MGMPGLTMVGVVLAMVETGGADGLTILCSCCSTGGGSWFCIRTEAVVVVLDKLALLVFCF